MVWARGADVTRVRPKDGYRGPTMSVRVSLPRTSRHPTQPRLSAQPWKWFPWGHRAGWESAFGTLSAHLGGGGTLTPPRGRREPEPEPETGWAGAALSQDGFRGSSESMSFLCHSFSERSSRALLEFGSPQCHVSWREASRGEAGHELRVLECRCPCNDSGPSKPGGQASYRVWVRWGLVRSRVTAGPSLA